MDLPKFIWAESVQHTTWLKNHTSTWALNGKTPFEMLFKQKPNLENLPEWGTCMFVLHKGHSKLDEKAEEGHWAGYSPDTQGHCIYWPCKCHVSVEQNVVFDTTVPVQRSVVEVEQNTPNINQTSTQNPTPTRTAPPPNVAPPDPLQGFEPEAQGCGKCLKKLSAYVRDIQEGRGVSSTHSSNTMLPHGPQQPSNTSHHATTAILEDRMDDEHPTIEYAMMAATNIMGIDPILISDAKKNAKTGLNGIWLYNVN